MDDEDDEEYSRHRLGRKRSKKLFEKKAALEAAKKYADALDELAEILPSTQNTEDTVEQREMLDAVLRFLETLPKTQSDLFVRRYWRFSSFEDLAHDYGMTVNYVRVTLTRLRKRLQKYLRKEGLL